MLKKQNPFWSNFIKLATVSERQAPPGQDSGMNRGSLSIWNCRQFNKITSERVLFVFFYVGSWLVGFYASSDERMRTVLLSALLLAALRYWGMGLGCLNSFRNSFFLFRLHSMRFNGIIYNEQKMRSKLFWTLCCRAWSKVQHLTFKIKRDLGNFFLWISWR